MIPYLAPPRYETGVEPLDPPMVSLNYLTIYQTPRELSPIQLPLPETDHLPVWVKAALDTLDWRGACFKGFNVLLNHGSIPALASFHTQHWWTEREVFNNLRMLALAWQMVNFRNHLTELETLLLDTEQRVLRRPMVMHRNRDAIDYDYLLTEIQQELYRAHIVMGIQQIRDMLERISLVLSICDVLDIPVERRRTLQFVLRKVA